MTFQLACLIFIVSLIGLKWNYQKRKKTFFHLLTTLVFVLINVFCLLYILATLFFVHSIP